MSQLCIQDMDRLQYLSVPELRPDGKRIAFVQKCASGDSRSFLSQIRVMTASGAPVCTLEDADLPRYSPDGQRLAYLCGRSGENQIWIHAPEGERQLTDLVHGVTDFIWAPDGGSLFFTARLRPEEQDRAFGEMTPSEKSVWQKQRADEPVVVEELIYKLDEVGLFDGSFSQIGRVFPDGTEQLLTSGHFEHESISVSGDGSRLYYYGRPYGSVHRLQSQLMVLSPDGAPMPDAAQPEGELWPCDKIPSSDGSFVLRQESLLEPQTAPVPSGTDSVLVLSYLKGEDGYSLQPLLVNVRSGEKSPYFASPCPTEEVNNAVVGRNCVGRPSPVFRLSEDGTRLYFTSVWMGKQNLWEYDCPSDTFRCLTEDDGSVQSFSAPRQGKIAVLRGTLTRPAELQLLDVETGRLSPPLTDVNGWLADADLPVPEELTVPSADGKAQIHGWYLKPKGLADGQTCPAVLDVHGGPDCSYSTNFWFEFQYLAARGMAVIWCDPRGSIGYGRSFHSGEAAYGGAAAQDLMTFLDAVCGLGFIDRFHCGVTGGSYGGFMTNWLITNTDRFAAAVTQRTLSNLATSYGTGDMGFVTGKPKQSMLKMFKDRASSRSTTVRHVDRIRTPLLLLHGVNDYRCSFEQAEQLYIAMKERRPQIPVRLVAFPGQNHGLTREGQPWAQKAHLREMADWFVTYLKDTPILSAHPSGPAWKDPEAFASAAPAVDPTAEQKEEQP